MKNKIKFLLFFCLISLTALCAHIFNISAIKQASYAQSAAAERRSISTIKKYRGEIYDRNMIPLVDSHNENYRFDSGEIGEIEKRYDEHGKASHIIGYTLSDGSGASGIEKTFDNILTANSSRDAIYMTDAAGGKISKKLTGITGELPCKNIKLTIDFAVQSIAEAAADKYLESGAIVILDTDSFDVVAAVSRPSFNQNDIATALGSQNSPLLNRALSSYNAGSIFKIITAAAYLENGGDKSAQLLCSGSVNADGLNFGCNKHDGHGILSLKDAFAKSCNCYFYNTAISMGAAPIIETAKKFSLGSALLNCDMAEASGHLPNNQSYSLRDAANIGIGQGEMLITPMQAANMACIIAAGGKAKSINLADSVVRADGLQIKSLRKVDEQIAISRETAQYVGAMMREAVLEGTAQDAQNGVVAIAGKTGTAETGWSSDGESMVHGWFCGYFPYENPKYAMAVFAENGKSGSAACIPAFRQIALEIMQCR